MKLYDFVLDEKLRGKKQRRKILFRGLLVFAGVIVISAGAVSARYLLGGNQNAGNFLEKSDSELQSVEFRFNSEPKSAGEMASLLDYKEDYALGIRYPTFGLDELDRPISDEMQQQAQNFLSQIEGYHASALEDRAVLSVDYDITMMQERYASVAYHVQTDIPGKDLCYQEVFTRLYDLEKQVKIPVGELFDDTYLASLSLTTREYFSNHEKYKETASTADFEKYTSPDWDNYENIEFTINRAILYVKNRNMLGSDKEVSMEIPLEQIVREMLYNITDYIPPKQVSLEGIDPEKPMVALTYDDGLYPKVTERILDTLEQAGGKATFFVLGERITDKTIPTIQRAVNMGCQIGNHTQNHKNLTAISKEEITYQISEADKLITDITGDPISMLRPPEGAFNDQLKSMVDCPIITWSVDTRDWKDRDAKMTTKKVLESVEDGDIILMHDLYESTAEASEVFIPQLIERGFQLVTVEELLAARKETVEAGKIYHSAPLK